MPFNGGGVFSRLYSWVADASAGKPISATEFDADENDIVAGLDMAILKDGSQTLLADIPFNGFGATELRDPTGAQDAVNLRTHQAGLVAAGADGCCRLTLIGTTQILLSPYDGAALIINGAQQVIPAAGVSYSAAGLTPGTTYYVYAFMSSASPAVMTLELSTTGYTVDGSGRANKTGDTTRRLVGMTRFAGATNFNAVASWFHRNLAYSGCTLSSTATASESPVSIAAAGFLLWNDESALLTIDGSVTSGAAQSASSYLYADFPTIGAAVQLGKGAQNVFGSAGSGGNFALNYAVSGAGSEGWHTLNLYAAVSTGAAASWVANMSAMTRN